MYYLTSSQSGLMGEREVGRLEGRELPRFLCWFGTTGKKKGCAPRWQKERARCFPTSGKALPPLGGGKKEPVSFVLSKKKNTHRFLPLLRGGGKGEDCSSLSYFTCRCWEKVRTYYFTPSRSLSRRERGGGKGTKEDDGSLGR